MNVIILIKMGKPIMVLADRLRGGWWRRRVDVVKPGAKLELVDSLRVLEIDAEIPFEGAGVSSEVVRRLLSGIVSQARCDGMTAVALSVDPEQGTTSMRYFGPANTEAPQWWEMVPPPVEMYPAMLQCVMMLGCLEHTFPIRGLIPAELRRQMIQIRFELPTLYELKLRWDA